MKRGSKLPVCGSSLLAYSCSCDSRSTRGTRNSFGGDYPSRSRVSGFGDCSRVDIQGSATAMYGDCLA